MKIVFIADSYGGTRIHGNIVDVSPAQTYPELVKAELEKTDHEVSLDFASFRKLTDLPELFQKYPSGDVYVVQTGIVDLYPRALTQKFTLSQSFFAKLIRRVIRLKRSFFIRNIYNKPWSTETDVIKTIENICTTYKSKIIWLNVAPVNAFQNKETPGANESIVKFNSILKQELKKYPNCAELDIYDIFMKQKNYEIYLHDVDSHPNVDGNKLYAEEVMKALKKLI